jgi:hypothetical protein
MPGHAMPALIIWFFSIAIVGRERSKYPNVNEISPFSPLLIATRIRANSGGFHACAEIVLDTGKFVLPG